MLNCLWLLDEPIQLSNQQKITSQQYSSSKPSKKIG